MLSNGGKVSDPHFCQYSASPYFGRAPVENKVSYQVRVPVYEDDKHCFFHLNFYVVYYPIGVLLLWVS